MTKKNILLDLDQTLISAEAEEDFDIKKHKDRAKLFRWKDMDGYYIVFERPHLQEFLDYIFSNFNVSIWTAASKDYALFIIQHIILNGRPERNLDFIFFSYHCGLSKKRKNNSKDLSMIWSEFQLDGYTSNNTVILDDYDEVFNSQKGNCIVADPFEFINEGSENDRFLKDLIPSLDNWLKEGDMDRPADSINSRRKKD